MHQHMQTCLKNKRWKHFTDISYCDTLLPHPYVDLTHYSKKMNKLLATQILQRMNNE
jgi:hypothetical protein